MQTARKMILAVILAVVAVCALCADTSTYYDGYYEDGYTYRGSYFWKDGYAYTRSKVYNPTTYYYSYGTYYPQRTYYYTYTKVQAAAPAYPTPQDADWRSKLLGIAQQRDKVEGQMRKSALENQLYLEAVKALGLEGNFRWQGYGTMPPYPMGLFYGQGTYGTAVPAVGSYGVSGNTMYGYSVNSLREYYGETNLNTLYQQANALAKNSQGLAGQATTEFQQLVAAAGDNAGRVAEILAKAQAAAITLNAANPQARAKESSSTTIIRSGPGSPVPNQPLPQEPPTAVPLAKPDAQKFATAVASPRCGGCHGDQEKEPRGNFRVSSFFGGSVEAKAKVIARLTTTNEKLRMPRNADGSAGPAISREELLQWLLVD